MPLQLAGMTTPGRLIACIVITEEGGAVANSRWVGSSLLFSEGQRTYARLLIDGEATNRDTVKCFSSKI